MKQPVYDLLHSLFDQLAHLRERGRLQRLQARHPLHVPPETVARVELVRVLRAAVDVLPLGKCSGRPKKERAVLERQI